MSPIYANGKICYIEIPATDIPQSVAFYQSVFGWKTRQRGDGRTAFDDGVGEVSGTWVTGRPPSPTPGLLFYVMVDSREAAIEAVRANGGEIVPADRRRPAGDHREVPRSWRERHRALSGAEPLSDRATQ